MVQMVGRRPNVSDEGRELPTQRGKKQEEQVMIHSQILRDVDKNIDKIEKALKAAKNKKIHSHVHREATTNKKETVLSDQISREEKILLKKKEQEWEEMTELQRKIYCTLIQETEKSIKDALYHRQREVAERKKKNYNSRESTTKVEYQKSDPWDWTELANFDFNAVAIKKKRLLETWLFPSNSMVSSWIDGDY